MNLIDHPLLSYCNYKRDMLREVVNLTFDLLTLNLCNVVPLWWSIIVNSLNWIWLTVPELGRLQFSIDRPIKVPFFTFFGGKGGQISNFIILNPKIHCLGQNDAQWRIERGGASKGTVVVAKIPKTGQKLSWVKLPICPDHPRRCSFLKFCSGVVSGRQFYISNFMKIGWGVSEMWRVEYRPLSLTWPMAYTTACTMLRAVITAQR